MTRFLIFLLFFTGQAAFARADRLSKSSTEHVQCVVVLAIIANDQQRGANIWPEFPDLAEDGARYADQAIATVMKDAGKNREEVRAEIVTYLSQLQTLSAESEDPDQVLRDFAGPCVDKMLSLSPSPTLQQCAAILSLAYEDARTRNGMTKPVKDLSIFAAVLEARAREELRAEGKTDVESDIVFGLAKERYLAQFKSKAGKKETKEINMQSCFSMARP